MRILPRLILVASCSAVPVILSSCNHDGKPNELQAGRTKARVESICALIDVFREDHEALPSKSQGLEIALIIDDRSSASSMLKDGWGRSLYPVISGSAIVGVYSVGPNGKDEDGRGDDISCRVPGQ